MLGGAGHMQDMANRIKDNKALLKRNKRVFDIKMKYAKAVERLETTYASASEAQLTLIRQRIREQKRQERWLSALRLFLVVLVMVALAWYFVGLVETLDRNANSRF
jgi:hypothetical protein